MAPSKQTDRRNAKKSQDEEPETSAPSGSLLDAAKAVVMGSCMVQIAPKLQTIVMDFKDIVQKTSAKGGDKAEKKDADKKEYANEGKENESEDDDAGTSKVFSSMQKRLVWHNMLGLSASGEESKAAWINLIGLERDWGPKNKGRKVQERIRANIINNLQMYAHILLALMVLRSFFFRSFFACLPWLCLYQFVSVIVPLDHLPQVPQLQLDKVPVEARVLATIYIHALVWLFFLYEACWRCYFLETCVYMGLVTYHAYAVRPVGS